MSSPKGQTTKTHGYAPVNGLKMYYEIVGTGDPLVFIPPAFGFAGTHSFPDLVQNHAVITVDLQGNGRTADIPDRPISIEQYAKDVVGLLKYLNISKADFLGESYGGMRAVKVANVLQQDQGIVISGIVMLSPLLEAPLAQAITRRPSQRSAPGPAASTSPTTSMPSV